MKTLTLHILPEKFSIWQLPPDAPLPKSDNSSLWSVTRTSEELSIVSIAENAPSGVPKEGGWRCIGVKGPLVFELTGVMASLSVPLAEAGISIFAISSFNTDYLLVKAEQLEPACRALELAGHTFTDQ
ncbi:ACT domain-containing protein [Desulfococcaceae bacterium HSG9]|nr:ACT domain-containing protein [Desulfococcaceae bacterium HSG9]